MEEVKNETNTTTQVVDNTEEKKGGFESLIGSNKYKISAPLFLMFAEYLGYYGPTLKWADELCNDSKMLPEYKMKFIEREAVTVLKEIQKKYSTDIIRTLYDDLYEIILKIYDENLKKLDLPF